MNLISTESAFVLDGQGIRWISSPARRGESEE